MRKRFSFLVASALVPLTPAWAQETPAQPKQESAVGEIVVTAQHRSENIQKVPIAISAFSNETLRQRGLTNIGQISSFTPNVDIKNTSGFAGSSQILVASVRGVGQNDFAFNLEPGVGVYIDGVYFARSLGAVADLLDLERIEVLKGPQGTLFGRNTIGGALNIVTRDPGKDFKYAFELTGGSFNRTDVRGSVDVPLIGDQLFSQVSFSYKRRDGYQKRIAFPGVIGTSDLGQFRTAGAPGGFDTQGGENAINLRGKLKWVPSARFNLLISADYTNADQAARPSTLIKTFAGPTDGTLLAAYNGCIFGAAPAFICSNRGTVGTSYFGVNTDSNPNNNRLPISDALLTGNIDTSYARGSNFDILKAGGVSATANLTLTDTTSVKSITAYRALHSRFGSENAAAPIVVNDASFDMNQSQFSQELQVSNNALNNRLKSIVGLYYFMEDGDLTDSPVFAEGLVQVYGYNHFSNLAFAAFAHEHFDVTDKFGLTFGMRYTKENKEFEGFQKDLNSFFLRGRGVDPTALPLSPAVLAILPDPTDPTRVYPVGKNKLSFSNVSFKAGAEYKFSSDLMTYYSFSQGFKSGGWTTRLLDVISPPNDISQLTFRPETANTHELGLKSTLLNRKLRLNLAAFSTDYDNMQVTVYNGLSPVFKNGGKATIRGFEAEAQAKLGELSINGSVGYLDAYYRQLSPGVTFAASNKLVNTPEWSAALGGFWRHALANGSALSLAADYSYKSNVHPDAENSRYLQSGNVGILDGSIGYTGRDERWSLTLGVRNLTDKRFVVGGFDQSSPGSVGFVSATYSPPRQWYLTLRVHD
ncbi:TonB-dependent receptor [Novosphingobium sp. KACC 22771]|uniref:TonB-dependent receptor n=1 Tax=Novosphingobium sp. KACC 22771 TaxID=3025670 RepID=UPI0023665136|nr:TonB-dependent receptor [Novosphingobium sp. KACC 22771]WDF74403.1 TonB-dependent receptor [Novosphingobium sp. KACC 22771]